RGKTIGIHASGNVARNGAEISNGFGMEAKAFDPFVSPEAISSTGVKVCSGVMDLYSSCQYVTLHMPANSQTIKSVGYDLMMSMPPDAVLVNTARKEVINEDDLLKVFADRADFRYIADIEPACRPQLEEKFEGRYLFTAKKMGAQTEEANINAGIAAARQIVDYFLTGNEKFRLNK
ncbi:MAG: 3-phosphoglycerate dehydrogenase, partial [Bacteroidales bacterium]|nr:3-phosphoglycerate dehydrogenase [Bacteroidales bacterium]